MDIKIELTAEQYEIIIAALTEKVRRLEMDNSIIKYNADALRERLKEAEKDMTKKGGNQ